jgi:hypothetical protein
LTNATDTSEVIMLRIAMLSGALLTALSLTLLSDARAGATNGRWCLRDTGAQTVICSFSSKRQCLASKNGTHDTCFPNPARR